MFDRYEKQEEEEEGSDSGEKCFKTDLWLNTVFIFNKSILKALEYNIITGSDLHRKHSPGCPTVGGHLGSAGDPHLLFPQEEEGALQQACPCRSCTCGAVRAGHARLQQYNETCMTASPSHLRDVIT